MKKLLVSFSGGATSGFMATWCKANLSKEYDIKFIFANTGEEHERTLEFVNQCDNAFGLNLIWVEADVQKEKGQSTKHKIVNFETASRKGEPLKAIVEKFGVFNKSYPHCNRESKLQPIQSWKKENDWLDCFNAVGIRADEIDRRSSKAEENKIIYPLMDMYPVSKKMIADWWDKQPFKLGLPEHYGNCKTCWKKSDRKLKTIALEHPEWFNFYRNLEDIGSKQKHYEYRGKSATRMFREYRSVEDLIDLSKKPFKPFTGKNQENLELFAGIEIISPEDQSNGCDESCEAFIDEGLVL
jgi:hypothetical protein